MAKTAQAKKRWDEKDDYVQKIISLTAWRKTVKLEKIPGDTENWGKIPKKLCLTGSPLYALSKPSFADKIIFYPNTLYHNWS